MQTTPNQTSKLNLEQEEYLIDAPKILAEIRKSWRILLSIIAITSILALLITFVIPKQWEATTTIQIGKMPSSSQTEPAQSIEDPTQTVERIKLREFRDNVLTKMGLPLDSEEDKRTELLLNSLKGVALKGTDFVNLTAEGYNTEDANTTLKLATEEIQTEHKQLIQPARTRLINDLAIAKEKITSSSAEVNALKSQLLASGAYKGNSAFEPSIVAINLLSTKEEELQQFKSQENLLSMQIGDFETQSTKVINKIQVSKRAVFPKRSVFLGLGILLGALLGLVIILIRLRNKTN